MEATLARLVANIVCMLPAGGKYALWQIFLVANMPGGKYAWWQRGQKWNAGQSGRGEQQASGEEVVTTSGAFSFLGITTCLPGRSLQFA